MIADYDEAKGELLLDLEQTCPPTPGQPHKDPFVIPIAFGLMDAGGAPLPLQPVAGSLTPEEVSRGIVVLGEQRRSLRLGGFADRPIASFLRGFSAPVRLDAEASDEDLAVQMAFDADSFNRWQAAQTFAMGMLLVSVAAVRGGREAYYDPAFAEAMGRVLDDAEHDPAFAALVLALPGESDLAREIGRDVDPDAIHAAREALRAALGKALAPKLLALYEKMAESGPYSPAAEAAGRRALRNAALDLLAAGNRSKGLALARVQFEAAANMTDRLAALAVLARAPGATRSNALATFYEAYKNDALVVDKWFVIQATQPDPGTPARVRDLMKHPAFSLTNPNRVRSLIGAFATANPTQFAAPDGCGFALVAQAVIDLDRINAQVAARMLAAFRSWRSLEDGRRDLAQQALRRVAATAGLSVDTADIVTRSLA